MENTPLTQLLRSWPHEPGRLNARAVKGEDGRPLVLVRVELGILQIERSGRPDGVRPGGHESLLHLELDRLATQADRGEAGFVLDEAACKGLRDEAALFSYRSVVLSSLDDCAGVLRDLERNLQVAGFIVRHAEADSDRAGAEASIAQLLVMRVRASSTLALRSGDIKAARDAIESGLRELEAALRARGGPVDLESSPEVAVLLGMREMLVPKLPASQRLELEARLKDALAMENFELAAILRNELRLMS
jgi:hypothetical protein